MILYLYFFKPRIADRAVDRNYVSIEDIKRLLFRTIVAENIKDFDLEEEIVLLLNKVDSGDKYNQVRELIDHLEHITREIIEQNGNIDLKDILHEKLSKLWDLDKFKSLHPSNIKYIIKELNKLESKPAKVSLEHIGASSSLLKWEEIIESQLKSGMSGFPITEFCIKENYKETNNNNLLSRIWIKYFGDNSIPYEEKGRNILIGKLQEEFEGLDRHINHWRVEFNEEN